MICFSLPLNRGCDHMDEGCHYDLIEGSSYDSGSGTL